MKDLLQAYTFDPPAESSPEYRDIAKAAIKRIKRPGRYQLRLDDVREQWDKGWPAPGYILTVMGYEIDSCGLVIPVWQLPRCPWETDPELERKLIDAVARGLEVAVRHYTCTRTEHGAKPKQRRVALNVSGKRVHADDALKLLGKLRKNLQHIHVDPGLLDPVDAAVREARSRYARHSKSKLAITPFRSLVMIAREVWIDLTGREPGIASSGLGPFSDLVRDLLVVADPGGDHEELWQASRGERDIEIAVRNELIRLRAAARRH